MWKFYQEMTTTKIVIISIMKKIIFSLLFVFSFLASSGQKDNSIYLKVNNNSFWPAFLGYKAVLGFKSKDDRFRHDNYYFDITYNTLDHQSLYSLGIPININAIDYIDNPLEYFKDLKPYELHERFSLYKNIYIITEIPKDRLLMLKDKTKTHLMFSTSYGGTQKNVTWINNTGKKLIDQ